MYQQLVKLFLKYGAGYVAAGTLGTIGVAAGLASDDDKDILKYGLAGAAGGYAAGSKVGKSAANIVSNTPAAIKNGINNVRDTYGRGAYGRRYDEIRENRAYRKDKEVIEYHKQKYNDDWKKRLELNAQLRERGIKNQKDLDKVSEYVNRGEMSISQAADLMKFKEKVTISDLRGSKRKDLEDEVEGLIGTGNTADRDRIMGYLDEILGRK